MADALLLPRPTLPGPAAKPALRIAAAGQRAARFEPRWISRASTIALLGAALPLGAATVLSPKLAITGCLAIALVAGVAIRPQLGGYLVIAVTPLIAGIDRGNLVPMLRPGEALALLIGMGLALRGVIGWRSGSVLRLRVNRLERALLLMAVCNSVVPMLWMLARQHPIGKDDILYALVLWKFIGIYVLVRVSIRTGRQVSRCLWLSVGAAAVVAVLAILQSLGVLGVPRLLSTYYAPFGYTNLLQNSRGSSTLALPAATADLMIYNLAIVSGLWLRSPRSRPALLAVASLLVIGTLSAGEFSSAIGLAVGISCIAVITSYPRILAFFVPAAVAAVYVLRPVIERRLNGFDSVSGLPVSWTGRLNNLESYFWPRLGSDWNYLLGVQPSARIPLTSQGTGYVWIESGYTWLLWGGGIPLALSFGYFVYAALRMSWLAARRRTDPAKVAGIAVFVAVIVMSVLMIFDPHLTYRGAAEEMFALLALAGMRPAVRFEKGHDVPRPATQVEVKT